MKPYPPMYEGNLINSVEALASELSVSVDKLLVYGRTKQSYYSLKLIPKQDGTLRKTYRVREPLRSLHRCILDQVLSRVAYPSYLQGGIRDPKSRRDYVRDAAMHAGQYRVLSEDIRSFFPSVKSKYVMDMWCGVFGFPEGVSQVLTALTTYQGFLPQGASTSTHIANLILWDVEPEVELKLRSTGYVYTRYIDDITISSDKDIDINEQRGIRSQIAAMLARKELEASPAKRYSKSRPQRPQVHGLYVDSTQPTLSRKKQSSIRAAVKQCETEAAIDRSTLEYSRLYSSTWGRLAEMKRLHPARAKKLIDRLLAIPPQSGPSST